MNFGRIIENICVTTPTPSDPRCQDIAFAIANPSICPVQPKLIIKPGVALTCALGSIQFKAFFTKNGIETDVTDQTIWTSGDLDIALIGAISGNCTGVTAGEVQISATYQGLTATAMLSVFSGTNCCDEQNVAMLIAVDMSRSMSQQFDGTYATRLSFAKAAASRFISEVNTSKDTIGLMYFDGVQSKLLASPSSDKTAVGALVPTISQGQQKTEFYDAAVFAVNALSTVTADRKVIVLISDGEDTLTQTFTQANDPIVALSDFKNQGGIVICLGCRASGNGFALLSGMSTGGFFINGYSSVASDALDFLSGLKGYICAGSCVPTGDVILHQGQLNYTAFSNWNVVDGTVDLCGNGFFDFLPGNGLYVDLGGTAAPQEGVLTLKTALPIVSGRTYRLTVRLAGNQRLDEGSISALLRLYDPAVAGDFIHQNVVIADYTQNFQNYAFSFTAASNGNAIITIQQNPTGQDPRIGLLLDRVTFEDRSTLTTLFDDNFDTENPTYVPPGCGTGSVYAYVPSIGHYGYVTGSAGCSGVGCLDSPPPAQLPDPAPLSDIESGYTPPKTYTSEKTACATCPTGSMNVGAALIPVMTGYSTPSGTADASSEEVYLGFQYKAWYAFRGQEDNSAPSADQFWTGDEAAGLPAWLRYKFDSAQSASVYLVSAPGWISVSWQLQGSNDGSKWTTLDTQTAQNFVAGAGQKYQIATPASYLYYRVNFTGFDAALNGSAACSAFQLYGTASSQICETDSETSTISQADADAKASAAALAAAQAQLRCQTVYTSTQQYTASCPVGSFGQPQTRSATATSFVSQADADAKALAAATAAANAALNCSGSNNTQKITIPGVADTTGPASPYPSVKAVTGQVGVITKVTATIKKLTHASVQDVHIVLRSPSGTYVELMRRCGGFFSVTTPATIVFDDAAGSSLPNSGGVVSGTFKPTQYGPVVDLVAPASPHPYQTTLAALIGETPNGSWSLWCEDLLAGEDGSASDGFDLVVTSA